jgi:hypothetical protein
VREGRRFVVFAQPNGEASFAKRSLVPRRPRNTIVALGAVVHPSKTIIGMRTKDAARASRAFEARQGEANRLKLLANSRLDAPEQQLRSVRGRTVVFSADLGLCDPWRPDKLDPRVPGTSAGRRQSWTRRKGVAR